MEFTGRAAPICLRCARRPYPNSTLVLANTRMSFLAPPEVRGRGCGGHPLVFETVKENDQAKHISLRGTDLVQATTLFQYAKFLVYGRGLQRLHVASRSVGTPDIPEEGCCPVCCKGKSRVFKFKCLRVCEIPSVDRVNLKNWFASTMWKTLRLVQCVMFNRPLTVPVLSRRLMIVLFN